MVAALHWNKSGMLAAGVQKLASFNWIKCHASSGIPTVWVQKIWRDEAQSKFKNCFLHKLFVFG